MPLQLCACGGCLCQYQKSLVSLPNESCPRAEIHCFLRFLLLERQPGIQGQNRGQWCMTLDPATPFQQLPISCRVGPYLLLTVVAKHYDVDSSMETQPGLDCSCTVGHMWCLGLPMPTIIRTIILAEADKITILMWTSVVTLNNRNVACIFSTRLYELGNSGKNCFLEETS